jgi:hypothetical protein
MIRDETDTHSDAWTAFGVGVLGGVVGGLSLLSFAGILAVALIAIVGGFGLRPRPFGAAGVLLGWGASWLIVLAGAQTRCNPASCVEPDVTAWVAFALGLAAIGGALLVLGIGRPAWAGQAAHAGGAWLRWRPIRIAVAIILGAVAGLYAATLLIFGLATAVPIWLWFAWRHRSWDRRSEIVWLTGAAIGTFVGLMAR